MHPTPPPTPRPQVHPRAVEPRWQTLVNEVLIAADPVRVHAYATNASRWHEWHPATRSVDALPDRPLQLGEVVREHIRAGGRRFSASWTVVAADAPHHWAIVTDTPEGAARLTYRLSPARLSDGSPGTRFERTLECRSKGRLRRLLDPILIPLVLGLQSRRALAQLRNALNSRR